MLTVDKACRASSDFAGNEASYFIGFLGSIH
jgi:hypothetical protein